MAFVASGLLIAAVSGVPDRSQRLRPSRRTTAHRGLIFSFVDGIGVVRSVPALTPLVGLIGVMSFVRGAEMVLHVYVVRDRLGVAVGWVGLLSGAIGLGAVLAIPIASRAANSVSPVRSIVYSLLATAMPTASLALVTTTLGASAVLVAVGAGMVVFEVVIVVMVQRITPPASLGRVFGAINGASNTGKLIGALAAPALIAIMGIEGSLVSIGAAVIVVGAATVNSQSSTELPVHRSNGSLPNWSRNTSSPAPRSCARASLPTSSTSPDRVCWSSVAVARRSAGSVRATGSARSACSSSVHALRRCRPPRRRPCGGSLATCSSMHSTMPVQRRPPSSSPWPTAWPAIAPPRDVPRDCKCVRGCALRSRCWLTRTSGFLVVGLV